MLKLLIVAASKKNFSDFVQEIEKRKEVDLLWANSGQEALDMVSADPVDLVVADDNLKDMTGLQFALRLLSVNPIVNCAVVSSLDAEQFHEVSEGLGLISQLPPTPDAGYAEELLTRLKQLKKLAFPVSY